MIYPRRYNFKKFVLGDKSEKKLFELLPSKNMPRKIFKEEFDKVLLFGCKRYFHLSRNGEKYRIFSDT